MENSKPYVSCDVCGAEKPRFVLESNALDGPLVQCTGCGFRYVGKRRSDLTFGKESPETTTARVRNANCHFRALQMEEERRLAGLNASGDWISSGKSRPQENCSKPAAREEIFYAPRENGSTRTVWSRIPNWRPRRARSLQYIWTSLSVCPGQISMSSQVFMSSGM